MVNFIQAANDKIKITEDVSYLLNDALHVNTVFTASAAVTAGGARNARGTAPALRMRVSEAGRKA